MLERSLTAEEPGAGPIITGLIVGILVTLAFGLLPTVGAGAGHTTLAGGDV